MIELQTGLSLAKGAFDSMYNREKRILLSFALSLLPFLPFPFQHNLVSDYFVPGTEYRLS